MEALTPESQQLAALLASFNRYGHYPLLLTDCGRVIIKYKVEPIYSKLVKGALIADTHSLTINQIEAEMARLVQYASVADALEDSKIVLASAIMDDDRTLHILEHPIIVAYYFTKLKARKEGFYHSFGSLEDYEARKREAAAGGIDPNLTEQATLSSFNIDIEECRRMYEDAIRRSGPLSDP